MYGKSITVADREMVESQADIILDAAAKEDVAFLVVGDPFGATTHTDLFLRASRLGIQVRVIHNASIMNAVGACGLQLYHFGQTVSIPWWTNTWRPTSFYDKLGVNKAAGMHTLCLLDIKVKEISEENLFKGRKIYDPPRFMTVQEALQQLVEIEADQKKGWAAGDCLAVGLMRVGSKTQRIIAGTIDELLALPSEEFGGPLHSLILPSAANMHDLEHEMLQFYAAPNSHLRKQN